METKKWNQKELKKNLKVKQNTFNISLLQLIGKATDFVRV